MMTISRIKTRIQALRAELKNKQDGFTLIEMLVVIVILAAVGTVVSTVIINATKIAADFNNPPSCQNQGVTAQNLCQIQQIATTVKGTNELAVVDRDAVEPYVGSAYPSTLVWQTGTTPGGDVCVVGYDLSDATSTFTHAKPFVFASRMGVKSLGIGCGSWNADGTYAWLNDPTIVKVAPVLKPNNPKSVRIVGPAGTSNVINGTMDAVREGEKFTVLISRTHGDVPADRDPVDFKVTYQCSNGYQGTGRIQAAMVTTGSKATWKGHLVTYGSAGTDVPSCNPTGVSLLNEQGKKWTLDGTYPYTF